MNKLTLLVLSSVAALGLTACPKDKDKKPDPAATVTSTDKPADKATDKPDDKPTEKPADKPADRPADPAAADLPAECKDYQAAIEKAAGCEKLGAQRDALKQAFEAARGAWAKIDPATRQAVADGCKTAALQVQTALTAACP